MNELQTKLEQLLDEAVSEGRSSWDSYYGRNNTYHLGTLRESPLYAELMEKLK